MKILLLAILLIAWMAPAHSALYRWVDEQGNVQYSDQPPPGKNPKDIQVDEKSLPPVIPSKAPAKPVPSTRVDDNSANDADVKIYKNFEIVEPKNDSVIRENTGAVTLAVAVSPPLRGQGGHKFVFYLNGNPVGSGAEPSVKLDNVDRGIHQAHVEIVDKAGKVIATSASVSFTLQRFLS